jgi:N-acetylglucosaminyl-diphospho-decaprenol L-rhamnosyltransferase
MTNHDVTSRRLDVLVVAYKSEGEIGALLASLAQVMPYGTRVLIWSNSDVAELRGAVAEAKAIDPSFVHVYGDGSNSGFAAGCNRLAELSSAESVMFLNPDTVMHRFTESALASTAIIAPLVVDAHGTQQRTFGRERTLPREAGIRLLRRDERIEWPSRRTQVGFCSGACFVVDRLKFLQMGGFDTSYFMYYEDLDFCRRWRRAGGTVVVEPEFVVMHIGGASASKNMLVALQRSFESAAKYHSKSHAHLVAFTAVALLEAAAKAALSLMAGRVGRVDRRTQLRFLQWLASRTLHGANRPPDS